MPDQVWSPLELRELHLQLAVEFEAETLGAEGDEIELTLIKSYEAFRAAERFEELYLQGVREVTRAQL